MTKISAFTPISYERESSFSEKALSRLSNYFYLGGVRAVVVKNDEVRLEKGSVPWYKAALKVSSYLLLFPLTATLFAVNLSLRHRHNFTVLAPPKENEKTFHKPKFDETIASNSNSKPTVTTKLPESKPVSNPKLTKKAESVEKAKQKANVLPKKEKEKPFRPFAIKIQSNPVPKISTEDEMLQKAKKLAEGVNQEHIQLRLDFPDGPYQVEAEKFIEELRKEADVIKTRWNGLFYIIPKRSTEKKEGDLTVREYCNGVVDEVESSSKDSSGEDWEGRRIFPDGKIETGSFVRFELRKGTYVEKGVTTYRLPDCLIEGFGIGQGLMELDKEGENRIIVLEKKPHSGVFFDYVQIEEDPIVALTQILKDGHRSGKELETILSGPIKCKDFVDYLFESKEIFSTPSFVLANLFEIIQKNGIEINYNIKHPETGESLLDCHLKNSRVIKAMLSAAPDLIKREEGKETAFIKALIAGNKKGASLLLKEMEGQHIELLPRELVFKKIAFSVGEMPKVELENLSIDDRQIAFQLANSYSHFDVIRDLRAMGFNRIEELLMEEGPSIFGYNMDALEMQETLHNYLTHLRSEKLLLLKSEFKKLDADNYMGKGNDIGRILGRDYIERKAKELGLKHIKVPKKMIVFKDDKLENVKLRIDPLLNIQPKIENIFDQPQYIKVYAEKIKRCERKITPDEVSELLRLFEETGFCDIHWANIIIAEDGIYIIDTEFTNFWVQRFYFRNGGQFAEMAKIVHALPIEQQNPLIDHLNAKMKTYRAKENELEEEGNTRRKQQRDALKKTGCIHRPSFTILNDSLTKLMEM